MRSISRMAARLAAAVSIWLIASVAVAQEGRALSDGWRFVREDVAGAEAATFDDGRWAVVSAPHTYNIEDSGIGGAKARGEPEGVYYRGPAWYRLRLDQQPEPGRRYLLEFGAVALKAEIWLNGRKVGDHEGGYAAFRFDVTDFLTPGPNVLAVRVDNARNTNYAPLNGDFNVFGGLTRPVRLIETAEIAIDRLDHAGPGLQARTIALDANRASVGAKVQLRNDGTTDRSGEVVTRILDADGRTVATTRSPIMLTAGQTRTLDQTLTLRSPRLWEGRRSPYRYSMQSELIVDRRAVDSQTVPFGVRTFAVTPEGQFLLNGQPYALYGVNLQLPTRHGQGPIVTDAQIDEDVRLMYDMGVTGIRLAHMQHPGRVYDEADRLGIVVATEVPLIDNHDASDAFRENLVQQMRELIAQTYNHPSVALWGIGNEIRVSDAASNRILAELQATVRELDPLRPSTYAHCCLADDDPVARHSDTVSYNRYFGWYWTEPKDIGAWADETHAKLPGRPIGVSEYGAGASVLHQEDPVMRRPVADGYWHPEQWQATFHEVHWRELRQRPFLWSNFIWVGIDFPSFKRNEGDRPAINDKGLVTEDRQTLKDAYFWYQANWSDVPMMHINSRRDLNKRTRRVNVRVYSNQSEVRLRLNGGEWTTVPVDDHIAVWPIDLATGANIVEAEAGDGLTDRVEWNYQTRP
jgi:hypothetical protein